MASFNKDGSPKGGRPVLRKPGGSRLKTNAAFKNEHGRDRKASKSTPTRFNEILNGSTVIMDSFIDGGE